MKSLVKTIAVLMIFVGTHAQASLIGYWDANGDAQDYTGSNDGTLNGDTSFVSGVYGSAFSFDGVGDSVYIAPTLPVSSGLTMSAWINPTVLSSERMIFNNESSYEMAVRNGTFQYAIETDAPGGWFWVNTGLSVTANAWQFFAVTFDGASSKVFNELGQVVFSSNAITGNIIDPANSWVHIGARLSGTTSNFIGAIDEVYIFDSALESNDVLNIANNAYFSEVSEPSTIAIVLLTMGGLILRRKKSLI
ncbi:PEP-CTERM sorting domain-containing protein [Alteromonas sp. ASW11-36]|uniref:PEP-CTERM sorting domain-containing protein n=1 Tax=Alteromonas arenosi TaxID=3055817 RepID=A0ABT7T152_9ALTE|nr:LamG-like jellyroll fold domain-containing protein [Alteromonas sp. ASW11-36]MDM7861539.1 PEP-CTERM sorting domain-containing protein [Alteromonas sp. ASW11-36]